jgi:ribosome-binding protein aMBF1 (putative translation factor)
MKALRNIQVIKSRALSKTLSIPFALEDYVDNPVALARIKARMTQDQLAQRLGVSQAYISKLEQQTKVTATVLANVRSTQENVTAKKPKKATFE